MKEILSIAVLFSLIKPGSFIKLIFIDASGTLVGFLLHGGEQSSLNTELL